MIYVSNIEEFNIYEEDFLDISNVVFKTLSLPVKDFSLSIVRQSRMRMLNKKYFNINLPTDVIALEYKDHDFAKFFIGDIFICPRVIYRNSVVYNVDFMDEVKRSFVHGLLHILGFDHKKPLNNEEEIFKIQEQILRDIK
ncbi:rRNA maturation RNase YbeY [Patescibacteria group bacterium]|nr:rRNA maturation RNase YbeY [Patescibacteria group bacterium]